MDWIIKYNSRDIDYDEIISNILAVSEIRQQMISLAEDAIDNVYIEDVSVMTDYYYSFSYDNVKLITVDLVSSKYDDSYIDDNEISLTVSTPAKIECNIHLDLEKDDEQISKSVTKHEYIDIYYHFSMISNNNLLEVQSISADAIAKINLGPINI